MALNLNDRIVLMQSPIMQTRVQAACVKYALYLSGGSPSAEQASWAKGCLDNAADMGRRVAVHLLDEPNFLDGGSDITDSELQGAVEAAVNSRFIQPAP